MAEERIAFATRTDPPGLEVRVNFGLLAGREATPAELEELGHVLVADVELVSVVAEQRHELSTHSSAAVHQVRIEVAEEHLPIDLFARAELAGRLVDAAEQWALECVAARHTELV